MLFMFSLNHLVPMKNYEIFKLQISIAVHMEKIIYHVGSVHFQQYLYKINLKLI